MKFFGKGKEKRNKKQEVNENTIAKRLERGEIDADRAYARLVCDFSGQVQRFAEFTAIARSNVEARNNSLKEAEECFNELLKTDEKSAVALTDTILKGISHIENIIDLYLKQRQMTCAAATAIMFAFDECYEVSKDERFNLKTAKEAIVDLAQQPYTRRAADAIINKNTKPDESILELNVVATEADFNLCYDIFCQAAELMKADYFFNLFSTDGSIASKNENNEYVPVEKGFLGYSTDFIDNYKK